MTTKHTPPGDESPAGEATDDATPDEARAIMRALHAATSAPAPREDCPFALTPPKRPVQVIRARTPRLTGDE